MKRTVTGRLSAVIGVLAALSALGACGDSTEPVGGTTTTTIPATTTTGSQGTGSTTTTTASDGIDPLEGASTDPATGEATATGIALLTGVDIGRHEGYDRIVFTFAGDGLPGYRVEYVQPPITEDGSGAVVDIDGDFFIQVRLEPASGYDTEAAEATYTGPKEIKGSSAGTSELREAQQTGDFEAVLNWTLGLADRVDFRVSTLGSPARLVIDVRNH